jgi:uncharacterized protein YwgA
VQVIHPLVYVAQSVDFAKFQAEKYDFDLYKGFFVEKMAQIRQISKKPNPNC